MSFIKLQNIKVSENKKVSYYYNMDIIYGDHEHKNLNFFEYIFFILLWDMKTT